MIISVSDALKTDLQENGNARTMTADLALNMYQGDLRVPVNANMPKTGAFTNFMYGLIDTGDTFFNDTPEQVRLLGGQSQVVLGGLKNDKELIKRGQMNLQTATRNLQYNQQQRDMLTPESAQDSFGYTLGSGVTNYATMVVGGYGAGTATKALTGSAKISGKVAGAASLGTMGTMEIGGEAQERAQKYTADTQDTSFKNYAPEQGLKNIAAEAGYATISMIMEKYLGYGEQRRMFSLDLAKLRNPKLRATASLTKTGVKAGISEAGTEFAQSLANIGIDLIDGTMDWAQVPDRLKQELSGWAAAAVIGGTAGVGAGIYNRSRGIKIIKEELRGAVPEEDLERTAAAVFDSAAQKVSDVVSVELELSSELQTKHGAVMDSIQRAIKQAADESGAFTDVSEEELAQYIGDTSKLFADQVLAEATQRNVPIEEVIKASDIVYENGEIRLKNKEEKSSVSQEKLYQLPQGRKVYSVFDLKVGDHTSIGDVQEIDNENKTIKINDKLYSMMLLDTQIQYKGLSIIDKNDTQNNIDNTAEENIKKASENRSEVEKQKLYNTEYNKKAKNYFGTTRNLNEAGYILTDGSLLDLSGKNQGGSGGYRALDHLDVAEALENADMYDFINSGNIRYLPESDTIQIADIPTAAQYQTLSSIINKAGGEVTVQLISDAHNDSFSDYYREYEDLTLSKLKKDINAFYKGAGVQDITQYYQGQIVDNGRNVELTINSQEDMQGLSDEDFKNKMLEMLKSFKGKKIPNKTLKGDIEIRTSSIKKYKSFFADKNKRLIVPYIPELLEKARFISENTYTTETEKNIVAYWKADLLISIDKDIYNVHLTVKEDDKGNFFWDAQVNEEARRTVSATNPSVGGLTSEISEDALNITPIKENVKLDYQNKPQPKGLYDANKGVIKIFESADFSTLPHELAHYWLDNMWRYVRSGNASEKYRQRWNVIANWLNVKQKQAFLTRGQQEKFARGYEQYLLNGNLPTPIIKGAFDDYDRWLKRVYGDMNRLNVRLSEDAVRFFQSMTTGVLPPPAIKPSRKPRSKMTRAEKLREKYGIKAQDEQEKKTVEFVKESEKEHKIPEDAESRTIITSNITEGEKGVSSVYSRETQRNIDTLQEIADIDLEYNKVNLEEQARRAEDFVKNNLEEARKVVNGEKRAPDNNRKCCESGIMPNI